MRRQSKRIRYGRWVLTLFLVAGVLFETGPFTALAVALLFATLEVVFTAIAKRLDRVADLLERDRS